MYQYTNAFAAAVRQNRHRVIICLLPGTGVDSWKLFIAPLLRLLLLLLLLLLLQLTFVADVVIVAGMILPIGCVNDETPAIVMNDRHNGSYTGLVLFYPTFSDRVTGEDSANMNVRSEFATITSQRCLQWRRHWPGA